MAIPVRAPEELQAAEVDHALEMFVAASRVFGGYVKENPACAELQILLREKLIEPAPQSPGWLWETKAGEERYAAIQDRQAEARREAERAEALKRRPKREELEALSQAELALRLLRGLQQVRGEGKAEINAVAAELLRPFHARDEWCARLTERVERLRRSLLEVA